MSDLKSLLQSLQSVPKPQDGSMTIQEVGDTLGIGRDRARALVKLGIKEGVVEFVPRKVKNMVGVVTTVMVYRFKGKGRK